MKRVATNLLTFLITFSIGSHLPPGERTEKIPITKEVSLATDVTPEPPTVSPDPDRPADYLLDDLELKSGDFSILRKQRYNPESKNDEEYIVIKRGKQSRRLDVIFGGFGVEAQFGYFPFLNPNRKELFISQDTNRGGCQWILDPNDGFRMIFDGAKFNVGRERYDLLVHDFDGDGTKEIILPLTDFYEFQDKMGMSQIPFIDVIFQYDSRKREYLPANHKLRRTTAFDLKQFENDLDDFEFRSRMLSVVGELIFAGERNEAWRIFDRYYHLADKSEMKRRLKSILRNHPVYKYIYRTK